MSVMPAFINCPLAHQLDKYFSRSDSSIVDVRPEVYDALMNRRPVVALESTIITHGMPHPHNFETAIEVEKIVREQVIECGGAPLGDDELPPDVVRAPQQWLVIQINSSDTAIKRSFCFNSIMMILFDGTSRGRSSEDCNLIKKLFG